MTLIFQSYRTHDVPVWITRCLHSVKEWTEQKGFHYCFIDDRLFEYAPQWYRTKVRDNVQLVSDLSRLILAKKYLQEGYERVIWMDADLLIFDPTEFQIDSSQEFSFCKEVWSDRDLRGKGIFLEKVNNSVSVFHQDEHILDFYINVCLKLVQDSAEMDPVLVGTNFLTELRKIYPFPLLQNVGILSPALIDAIVTGKKAYIEEYLQRQGSAVGAANLCGSKLGQLSEGTEITPLVLEEVCEKLLLQKSLLP